MQNRTNKIEQVSHLKLHSLETITSKASVIIVGNAYGIMPYIVPIAEKINLLSYKPYWFAFSGQEKTSGYYSYKECTDDIKIVSNWIIKNNPTKPLYILSHCAGSLMTLEYLKNNPDHKVTKLIIYGLLYAMDRRRPIAERKLKQCDVKYKLSEEDWNYRPIKALSETRIPILFCHAKDNLNLDRASEEELNLSNSSTPNGQIIWYEKGYDEDLNVIDSYVDNYISFLKN